jgi:hypothetical protein
MTVQTTLTLGGKQTSTAITSSVPSVYPNALVSNTSDVMSGVILYAYFDQPSLSGNTVSFTKVVGGSSIYFVSGGLSGGTIIDGSLAMTATSPNVGGTVTGTLQFSTATANYTNNFTGRITASTRVKY